MIWWGLVWFFVIAWVVNTIAPPAFVRWLVFFGVIGVTWVLLLMAADNPAYQPFVAIGLVFWLGFWIAVDIRQRKKEEQ